MVLDLLSKLAITPRSVCLLLLSDAFRGVGIGWVVG